MKNAFDERASLYSYAECDVSICGADSDLPDGIVYSVMTRPRLIGIKFSQKF